MRKFFVDIEVYDTDDKWAQAKYLVHGFNDVLWTDDLNQAIYFLHDQIIEAENGDS